MIRQLAANEIVMFLPHAEKHAKESGNGTTIRFGLSGPSDPFNGDRIRRFLESGLSTAVGMPGWCRVWIADGLPEIRGHASLRVQPQPQAAHRALVSVGVLEPYRRQHLAVQLLEAAVRWATEQGSLEWLDSEVFGHNEPALSLHRKLGFSEVGRVTDMYRIEAAPVDDVRLTLHLRRV